jgi:hypothetical protein
MDFELKIVLVVWTIVAWTLIWIWFKMAGPFVPTTKLVTQSDIRPEAYRNCDPEPEKKREVTDTELETDALLPSSTLSPKDKDTQDLTEFPANTESTVELVQKLENDHLFYHQQINEFQQKFQTLTSIIEGFEQMDRENRSLKEEVESLTKTALEYEMMNAKKDEDQSHVLKCQQIKKDIEDLSAKPLKRVKSFTNLVSGTTEMDRLKAENLMLKSNLESIRQEKASAWQSIEFQQNQEILNLKATIQNQNEMLSSKMSELDRVKDENHCLTENLDSLKECLAEKLTNIDELQSQVLEGDNQISQIELRNDDLMKCIEVSLQTNQELKTLIQEMREERDTAILAGQNSERLADEQVAALSGALLTLQEAAMHSKEAGSFQNIAENLLKNGPAKTKAKETWIRNWLVKHGFKTPKPHKKSEHIQLLENTGFVMVESAKNLHEQAENVKIKGKELKKEAKKLSRQ